MTYSFPQILLNQMPSRSLNEDLRNQLLCSLPFSVGLSNTIFFCKDHSPTSHNPVEFSVRWAYLPCYRISHFLGIVIRPRRGMRLRLDLSVLLGGEMLCIVCSKSPGRCSSNKLAMKPRKTSGTERQKTETGSWWYLWNPKIHPGQKLLPIQRLLNYMGPQITFLL